MTSSRDSTARSQQSSAAGSAPLRAYHHGDLRQALIDAAAAELAENGIEALTLRGCARRAGVSHAAPAHHFGDITGLLTEVAIAAHGKLATAMRTEVATAQHGSAEHLVAVAMGYVRFAISHPGEFSLMFRLERLDETNARLIAAGAESFGLAAEAVGAFRGLANAMAQPQTARQVAALWSLVHGFAGLLLAGQFGPLERAGNQGDAMLPDMVRALFGLASLDLSEDLVAIAEIAGST